MQRYTLYEVLLGSGLVGVFIFNLALFIWNLYDGRFSFCIINAVGVTIVVVAVFIFTDAVKTRRECDRIRESNNWFKY